MSMSAQGCIYCQGHGEPSKPIRECLMTYVIKFRVVYVILLVVRDIVVNVPENTGQSLCKHLCSYENI